MAVNNKFYVPSFVLCIKDNFFQMNQHYSLKRGFEFEHDRLLERKKGAMILQ